MLSHSCICSFYKFEEHPGVVEEGVGTQKEGEISENSRIGLTLFSGLEHTQGVEVSVWTKEQQHTGQQRIGLLGASGPQV